MSFTRFYDDESRIRKQLAESTFLGQYMLNAPGPGKTQFMEDCYLRLQRFGANVHNNGADIESDMRGLTRKITRDDIDSNNYRTHAIASSPITYGTENPFVEESRYSHPAWETLETDFKDSLSIRPNAKQQNYFEPPFNHNLSSRNEDKDMHDAGLKRPKTHSNNMCNMFDNHYCQFENM